MFAKTMSGLEIPQDIVRLTLIVPFAVLIDLSGPHRETQTALKTRGLHHLHWRIRWHTTAATSDQRPENVRKRDETGRLPPCLQFIWTASRGMHQRRRKDLGSGSYLHAILKAITFFGPDSRRRTFAMTCLLCHRRWSDLFHLWMEFARAGVS